MAKHKLEGRLRKEHPFVIDTLNATHLHALSHYLTRLPMIQSIPS